MPSFLITGSEGQLGRCFHAVAQEFPEHQLIFTKKKKIDLTLPNTFESVYVLFSEVLCLENLRLLLFPAVD